MKYKYFGTAASEAIPAMYCNCDTCKRARKVGGKSYMSRSQSLVDDKILIDFPPDTFMHIKEGLNLLGITTYIITHSHRDHFYIEDLYNNASFFARQEDLKTIDVYVGEAGYNMLMEAREKDPKVMEMYNFHKIEAFKTFEAEGYRITPLKALHDARTSPFIFIIEKGGKAFLHGNDTAYFPEETREWLKNNPIYLDFASLDCTYANNYAEDNEIKSSHMNYQTVLHTIDNLKEIGMIDDKTKLCINHFSHNGDMIYDELCAFAAKDNIEVSYDGKEIEF